MDRGNSYNDLAWEEGEQESKTIEIATSNLGRLIGKEGRNIKRLQADTDTRLEIAKNRSSSMTEVTIFGNSDAIRMAEEKIISQFANDNGQQSNYPRSGNQHFSEGNQHFGDGNRPFGDGNRQFGEGNRQFGDGNRQFGEGNRQFGEGNRQHGEGNRQFGEGNRQFGEGNRQFGEGNRQFAEGNRHFGEGNRQFGEGNRHFGEGNRHFSDGNRHHGDGNRQFGDENRQFNDGNRHFNDGNTQYQRQQRPPRNQFNGAPNSGSLRSTYRPVTQQAAPSYKQAPIEIYDFKAISEECDMLSAKYWAQFPPIKKMFYEELPEVAGMTQAAVDLFREKSNNIMVERPLGQAECTGIPNPVSNFYQGFHNYPEILALIKKAGFEKPSPIQSQSWPIIMSGKDLIGIAQTGTGKTLAFLLPALIHIDSQVELRTKWGKPTALVLAPTRELALQIEKEANKYNFKNLKSLCIYGGVPRDEQITKLKPGIDIIIATPGRLDDFVMAGHINPDTITYVVLDEADRMLDMGFEPQIRKTLYKIRPDRQTIMTSATWPSGVRRLAQSYMKDPYQVYVGSLDLVAVHSVAQRIVLLENDEDLKFEKFIEFVRDLKPDDKILVFVGKKAKASYLSTELACMGIECSCIHGDMEQMDREQSIADMMDNTSKILIATDIVSRGIDIQDVTHVINFDFPRNIEEYVHRVGRTGRAGKTGESISFFTWSDARHATELIKILDEASQEVPDNLRSMEVRYAKGAAKREFHKRRY